MTILPASTWHAGIVWFDDDRIFTITNVFLHGVPYMALVWVAGGRDWVTRAHRRWRLPSGLPWVMGSFYLLLVALAVSEEALWDRWIWHEHPELFGASTPTGSAWVTALVSAILVVPQATHYLLDRWIWRVGPDNPRLATQLGLRRA